MSVREALKKSRAKIYPLDISSGRVFVKALNGISRQLYTDLSRKSDGNLPLYTVAAIALCNEDGSSVFDVSTDKGVALANIELQEVDGADLQDICMKLFQVSGLTKDAVSEAEKKSEASPSA